MTFDHFARMKLHPDSMYVYANENIPTIQKPPSELWVSQNEQMVHWPIVGKIVPNQVLTT